MFDTGLDNELLALDTGLENSAMAADQSDVQTFWVITSRAKGGANNPFGGSANSNQTSQLVQMTEQELYQEYQDSGQLQDLFGSWDNYKGYVIESQDFIQTADWMTVTPEYETGSKEWYFLNGEDIAWGPGEREKIQEKIIQDRLAARTAAFNEWIGGEQGQALMQKYGIQPIIYNNDGDQFKWTGSGYQKTIKVDDHAGFADYVKAVLTSVVVGGVTGTLFNAAFSLLAPYAGLQHGTIGKILGMIFTGAGTGVGGSIAYEDAMNAINNPNVIVNLQDALDAINNQNGSGIPQDDGSTRYGSHNLPDGYIYNEARNAVIHVATGQEYPVTVGMYDWYVDLPPLSEEDSSGGGAGSSSASSSDSGGATTTTTATTTTSTGAGGENPGGSYEGKVLTNGTYGDIRIDDRDVWGEGNEHAGWILISNTGVWGKSGISVIYNPGSGFYQEIDWDNGTYDQRMRDTDQENPNPFDTSGTGGNSAGTSGTGTTTTPATPAPVDGDPCELPDGNAGVIEGGVCVPKKTGFDITGIDPWGDPSNTTDPDPGPDPSPDGDSNSGSSGDGSTTTTTASTPGPSGNTGGGYDITGIDPWSGEGIGTGTGTGDGSDGSGSGTGSGDGTGDGNGDGNGGNGNGLGAGGLLSGGKGVFDPTWTKLPQGHVFVPYKADKSKVRGTKYTPKTKLVREEIYADLWRNLS